MKKDYSKKCSRCDLVLGCYMQRSLIKNGCSLFARISKKDKENFTAIIKYIEKVSNDSPLWKILLKTRGRFKKEERCPK